MDEKKKKIKIKKKDFTHKSSPRAVMFPCLIHSIVCSYATDHRKLASCIQQHRYAPCYVGGDYF